MARRTKRTRHPVQQHRATAAPSGLRRVLEVLPHPILKALAAAAELDGVDLRQSAAICDALEPLGPERLRGLLAALSRDILKEACRALGLDDSGREKAAIAERLVRFDGATTTASAPPATAEPPARRAKQQKKNGGALGFEATLWLAADKLRNNLDAAEYKHVVLGLIFLKYISDAFEDRRAELVAQKASGADPEDPDEYRSENVFWVPKAARWRHLQASAKQPTIGKLIDDAMVAIERDNPSLKGVLPKDYARPALDKQRLGELIDLIAGIGLGDKDSRSKDIIGRVYEYFLSEFASAEGKKGGQFYTPQCIVKLLVAMLAPYKGRVYDPCCGSGGMFVQSEKFVEAHGGRIGSISIYGQESNPTTWRLARMNLAIRGIDGNLGAENADSFHRNLHKDLKADYILASPPFNSSDWGGEHLREDSRWKFGAPPVGNANYAWVQHFIHHLAPAGIAWRGPGYIGILQSRPTSLLDWAMKRFLFGRALRYGSPLPTE